MSYVKKGQSTMKQMAYAKQILGGQGTSKKQVALNSGYSPYVANSVSSHIENKPGFNHAMSKLALDSNNLALSAMHEFKARGFKDFTNKELVGALNAIGNAWAKFNQAPKDPNNLNPAGNKLRTVVLQQVENQTIEAPKVDAPASATSETEDKPVSEVEVADVDNPMDF
jgi:hypothetical protein